jgi:hypothetical protein
MLSDGHFATGCYQHNIVFHGLTTVFSRDFRRGILVIQSGADERGNALFVGDTH